jgi:hypothetical protein
MRLNQLFEKVEQNIHFFHEVMKVEQNPCENVAQILRERCPDFARTLLRFCENVAQILRDYCQRRFAPLSYRVAKSG